MDCSSPAWTSTPLSTTNGTSPNSSIYAREYASLNGQLINNPNLKGESNGQNNEFLVSSPSAYAQGYSDVSLDNNGDFVIVWESDINATWGVYGDYYTFNNSQYTAGSPTLLAANPNWGALSQRDGCHRSQPVRGSA